MCEWHLWGLVTAPRPPPPTMTNQWHVIDCLPRAHESLSFPRNFLVVTKLVITRWGIIGHENVMARVCSDWEARLQTSDLVLNKILSGDGMLSPGLSKPLLPLSSCEPLSVLWAPTIPASNCQVLDTFQDKTKYFTRWYFMSAQNVCPLYVFFFLFKASVLDKYRQD